MLRTPTRILSERLSESAPGRPGDSEHAARGSLGPRGASGRSDAPRRSARRPQPRLGKVASIGLGLALAVMVAVAVVGYRTTEALVETVGSVEHTRQVMEALDQVILNATTAGRARRNYALTGDDADVPRVAAAIAAARDASARVRSLTSDNPAQRVRLHRLDPMIADRFADIEDAIAEQRRRGADPAREEASALRGNEAMVRIAAVVDDMIGEERRLLSARQALATRSAEFAKWAELCGTAIGVAVIAVAFAGLLRENARRLRSEGASKKTAEALRVAVESAESANRELEAFSYSVAHDLRAPLRSIDGFSLAILEDCSEGIGETGRGHLRRVRAAARHMGQLIDGLLALSRVARVELRFEVVDLGALAAAAVEELRQGRRALESRSAGEAGEAGAASETMETGEGHKVTVHIAPSLTTRGDPRLLRIVFGNLLDNAFKFTATRPKATIEVGVRDQDGERVYFVRDDGVGFDQEYAGKLFGAFQRLHDAREFPGTGIGLATVHRVIARHGGRIWAEGMRGRGATFWFTLGSEPSGDA
jgi:signal transduction histidine kinase